MKQILGILLILLVLSCDETKKNSIPLSYTLNSENQTNQEIQYQPIFLNLNPNMSSFEFNQELEKSLPNRKFTIPINNYNFEFEIKIHSNRIVLEYNDIETIKFQHNKFKGNDEERFAEFMKIDPMEEELVDSFISLFKNKYPKQISKLPLLTNQRGEFYTLNQSERNLSNYGFNEENYLIFQDSIKTVFIGYTIGESNRKLDMEALNAMTFNSENQKISSTYREFNEYEYIRGLMEEYKNLTPYQRALRSAHFDKPITREKGLSLEINYMVNSDFELMKHKIYRVNEEFNAQLRLEDSLQKIKTQKENNNLNKI